MKRKKYYFIFVIVLFVFHCLVSASSVRKIQNDVESLYNSTQHPFHHLYQPFIESYVREGLPGLVMLIKTPEEGLWIGAAGMSRIDDGIPMQPHSLFHALCATKSYTATCILMLRDEGKLALDDKIDMYLSSDICDKIANGHSATIRHLLNKTAGIPCFSQDTINHEKWYDPFDEQTWNWQKSLERIYGKPAKFEAGTDYYYSDTNYVLLALIIDQAAGESHADYLSRKIIQPLNLTNTYYKNEPDYPEPLGLVDSYFDRYGDGNLENLSDIYNAIQGRRIGYCGMIMSVYDLAQFFEALFKGQLVSSDSLKEMKKGSSANKGFGLGISVADTEYGTAYGYVAKGSCAMKTIFHFPDEEVSIAFSTNIGVHNETPNAMVYTRIWQEILPTVFEGRHNPEFWLYQKKLRSHQSKASRR
jgi:D-alanyl-D-alanine carboxypeptidase